MRNKASQARTDGLAGPGHEGALAAPRGRACICIGRAGKGDPDEENAGAAHVGAGAQAVVRQAAREPRDRGRQLAGDGVAALVVPGRDRRGLLGPPIQHGEAGLRRFRRSFPRSERRRRRHDRRQQRGRRPAHEWSTTWGRGSRLAWKLLAEHGIFFVSINDIELFRLGMLMDEILASATDSA